MWNDSIVETVRRLPTGENDLSDLGFGCPILNGPDDRRALVMKIIDGIKYKEPGIRQELVDKLSGKVQPIPSDSMMTSDHVRRIREEGMEVGGHTSTHPILTSLSDDEALLEIRKGKQELEEIIGENLQLFAYPNGKYLQDFDDRHMAMVRDSGFKFAVTTDSGVANRHSQGLRIPRYTPWRAAGPRFSIDLLLNSFRKTQP